MPLVSWFSQPPEKLASFYLYDTRTRQFCRIRLELGRADANPSADTGTAIAYDSNRAVGFSVKEFPNDDAADWSANPETSQLRYKGEPLEGPPPKAGDGIYDAQIVGAPMETGISVSGVHAGNPVTKTPALPKGIEPGHLALLAQDQMLKGKTLALTPGNATENELVTAIKAQVAAVFGVGVQDFGKITGTQIHDKLIQQARDIATLPARKSLTIQLKSAEDAISVINTAIDDGAAVPNAEWETAFGDLGSAVIGARSASDNANLQETLDQVTRAQQAAQTALKSIGADVLAGDTQALSQTMEQAAQDASDWQKAETDSEAVRTARTNLEGTLAEAENEVDVIDKYLESGAITPNQQFETAFGDLQSALIGAANATDKTNLQETLNQITRAQQAVKTALQSIGADEPGKGGPENEIAEDTKSLWRTMNQAAESASNWETAETDSATLTDTTSVDDYMTTLSAGA